MHKYLPSIVLIHLLCYFDSFILSVLLAFSFFSLGCSISHWSSLHFFSSTLPLLLSLISKPLLIVFPPVFFPTTLHSLSLSLSFQHCSRSAPPSLSLFSIIGCLDRNSPRRSHLRGSEREGVRETEADGERKRDEEK